MPQLMKYLLDLVSIKEYLNGPPSQNGKAYTAYL